MGDWGELSRLVEQIREYQHAHVDAVSEMYDAKFDLLRAECELFNEGKVKGKNELERNAELWHGTNELKRVVYEKTRAAEHLKVECTYLQNQLMLKMKKPSQ